MVPRALLAREEDEGLQFGAVLSSHSKPLNRKALTLTIAWLVRAPIVRQSPSRSCVLQRVFEAVRSVPWPHPDSPVTDVTACCNRLHSQAARTGGSSNQQPRSKCSGSSGVRTMLKQILATSALIAIVAVSPQPATAAGKLRQLVVEPTGASADPVLLKKKFPTLVAQPANGIATPAATADAGNGGGNKGAKFIVAPSQGIPTQTADAGSGNGGGNGNGGGKGVQFIVAPGQGLPTPPEGGNQGKAKKTVPDLRQGFGWHRHARQVRRGERGSDQDGRRQGLSADRNCARRPDHPGRRRRRHRHAPGRHDARGADRGGGCRATCRRCGERGPRHCLGRAGREPRARRRQSQLTSIRSSPDAATASRS